MSAFLDLLRNRRSIRRYTDEPIDKGVRSRLEEALLRSPTSKNKEPWTFTFVDDPEHIAALSKCKPHGASLLAGAALAVVVSAEAGISDVWVEDCSIATILLQLTAQDLGLGSCWVQVRRRQHQDGRSAGEHVKEAIGLPDSQKVLSIVALGHPAHERQGRAADDLKWGQIRRS
ncbi:MAG: NAD(P)H-dependent dehydrogenase/reductase [Proteobacteria bacterium]|nr:NAD(P)H-dependent dehydrogenase/reductase [Pseudomonadota bacterium]